MATFTLDHAASPTGAGTLRRIGMAVVAFVSSVDLAIAQSHEVRHLMGMSDSMLARRSLRRDGIVQHVMTSMPG